MQRSTTLTFIDTFMKFLYFNTFNPGITTRKRG